MMMNSTTEHGGGVAALQYMSPAKSDSALVYAACMKLRIHVNAHEGIATGSDVTASALLNGLLRLRHDMLLTPSMIQMWLRKSLLAGALDLSLYWSGGSHQTQIGQHGHAAGTRDCLILLTICCSGRMPDFGHQVYNVLVDYSSTAPSDGPNEHVLPTKSMPNCIQTYDCYSGPMPSCCAR